MYSPLFGRFISADSIVQAPSDPSHGDSLRSQTLNRYSYTRNNPLKYVDPSGHCFGFALGLDTLGCIGLGMMIAGGLGMAGVVSYQLMPDQIKADAGRAIETLVTDLTRGPASINTTAGAGPQIDPAPALGYPLGPVQPARAAEAYPLAGESGGLQLTTPLQGSATLQAGWLPVDIGKNIKRLPNDQMQPHTKRGNAPTSLKDGKPIEIHHEDQNPEGPFVEMHSSDHRGVGNYSTNHPAKNRPSLIDRVKWRSDVRRYWREEWDRGRWYEPQYTTD
ncbi:MAG: hypothetical protein KatS3mg053_2186 [Candidatus Roseilinea sp.]|nr:MAG: hypothetical protein KatS3mg053_2186 [Candidatus Roseilinea sp.]